MTEFGAECLVVARRALILAAAFAGLLLVLAGLALWRLTQGPLDVTPLVARILPITIARGSHDRPAGTLRWDALDCAWEHPADGLRSMLALHARGLVIRDDHGGIADSVATLSARLTLASLVGHRIAPVSIAARGVRLALLDTRGNIDLDLPDMRPGRPPPVSLAALSRLRLADGRIVLRDADHDSAAWLDRLAITADRRPAVTADTAGGAWSIDGAAMLHAGGQTSRLSVATRAAPQGGIAYALSASALTPDVLAPFIPVSGTDGDTMARVAAGAADWHTPIALRVNARLVSLPGPGRIRIPGAPGMALAAADLTFWIGNGTISQRQGPDLLVHGGRIQADMDMASPASARNVRMRLGEASIALADPGDPAIADTVFTASGTVSLDDLARPRVIDADAKVGATDLDFATLGAVWPQAVLHGVRTWFTRNVTGGVGHDLGVRVHAHSASGPRALAPTEMTGGMRATGVRVAWLAPVPPLENVDVMARFAGVDALVLSIGSAAQPTRAGPIAIGNASLRIDGLTARDQTGALTLDADGALPQFLALLSEPRLKMLAQHKLPFTDPMGTVHAHLQLGLPLKAHIEAEDLSLRASATFAGVHLGNVVLGRDVDGAEGRMDATAAGLDIAGHGLMAGILTDALLHEDFGNDADDRIVEHLHAVSHLDPGNVARAALAPPGLFGGTLALATDYRRRRGGDADLDLALDLRDADIDVPVWHKPRGIAARARAHLGLRDGHVAVLDDIAATGPDLVVNGHGLIDAETVRTIVLDDFRVGRSMGHARIGVPTGDRAPIDVAVDAGVIDMAPLVHPAGPVSPPAASGGRRHATSRPWTIDLKADRLFYSVAGSLGGVRAHMDDDGARLSRADIRFEAPTAVHVALVPVGEGRHLTCDVADFGRLLSSFGVTDRVAGGHAVLDGVFLDRGVPPAENAGTPPFDGHLDIGAFELLDPPVALTAASRLSVYDWTKSSAHHFDVTRMHLPLRLDRPYLHIHDGRLGNDALGATVEGDADLATQTLALRGTIVPVFAINALPGRLPGIGRVFSPEKGGGFLATTFQISGPMAHPRVHVQPLSMLLPGALRKLVE